MNPQRLEEQIREFVRRTSDDIKVEAQKLLEEVRDPDNHHRVKENLREFGSWARKAAEEMAVRIEGVVRKAEDALNRAAERVGTTARRGQPAGAPPSTSGAGAAKGRKRPSGARPAGKKTGGPVKKTIGKKKS